MLLVATPLEQSRIGNKTMISVIIPVYNCEKYIREAVLSVLSNNYKDFEVIIVDDGSTDNSSSICKSFLDKRIRYFRKENGGVSSARNFALEKIKGDFFTFLDADDLMLKDTLFNLYTIQKKENADFVQASFEYFGEYHQKETVCNALFSKENINFTYLFMHCHRILSKLFRTEIVQKNRLRFNTNYSFAEDTLFTCQYLHYCKTIQFSEKITYLYRKLRNSNTLSNFCMDCSNVYFEIYKCFIKLMNIWGSTETTIEEIKNLIFGLFVQNYLRKCSVRTCIKYIINLFEIIEKDDNSFHYDESIFFTEKENIWLKKKDYFHFVMSWKRRNGLFGKILKRLCLTK